jgi:hypothetical protein
MLNSTLVAKFGHGCEVIPLVRANAHAIGFLLNSQCVRGLYTVLGNN